MVVKIIGVPVFAGFVIFTWCFHLASLAEEDSSYYDFPKVEGLYKYVVAVTSKAGVCTGTIINNDWIMTAAHCLYYNGKPIAQKDATIYAGIVNYDVPKTSTKHQTISSEIKVHPKFWLNKVSKYDVALVRLRDSMEFNDYIGSIKIAGDGWPQTNEDKTVECSSLGFGGYRSTAPPTKDLKQWNVSAAHGEKACSCARRFQHKRLICIQEMAYPLICRGDGGGPLVCDGVVRGIAHMVWNNLTCDDPVYPVLKCVGGPDKGYSTYTFLCPINDWLHKIVPDIPPTPETCEASYLSWPSTSLYIYSFVLLLLHF